MCTKFKNIGYVFGRMNRIWASSWGTRVLYMSALLNTYVIFFKEKLLLKKSFHSFNKHLLDAYYIVGKDLKI